MVTVRQTDTLSSWFDGLRDRQAQAKILIRIRRLIAGNAGDVKSAGVGISEMRIPHGPGYRVYYTQVGKEITLLLCGSDKSTHAQDIKQAKALASQAKGLASKEE